MNAPERSAAAMPDSAQALLRTLVVSDLAGSTALVERLGDHQAAQIIRRHDRLVRDLMRKHHGLEIDKTDGFLTMFERPIQAVAFALAYHRALKEFAGTEAIELSARTGIHVGDVVAWQNAPEDVAKGAKPLEVEGLVKPVASRLMGLALPGQILMSGVAYSIAHRAANELAQNSTISWCGHGRYLFKGIPEAVPVFEVGEAGIAPLKAPAWTGKAHRETPIWRRPMILVMEGVLVLALLALPLWYLLKPEPAIAFANRDWVVVGDLKNLTGDPRFDDALQVAFRIGLEQSRYVNVLPDLQVRDALTRMQRDPAQTVVDPQIGAEVAMREGARALVLPSIAEVGGRVRFTAEVVDPKTQTTVYSDYADGVGVESVLPSVDAVNSDLRQRLGEALTNVSADSKPLERVTTAQFDALRAYSLAVDAEQENRLADALALLERALEVDPEFATARLKRGVVMLNTGDRIGSLRELRGAEKLRDRVSARDRFVIEATIASLTATPRENIEKWRVLADLYPDFFPAQNTYGFYAWQGANDFAQAIPALERSTAPQNPMRGSGHYVLGSVLLAANRYSDALAQFTAYEQTGRRFENQFYAATYAAQRQFEKIDAVLDRGQASGITGSDVPGLVIRAVFALDQGDFTRAQTLLERARDVGQATGWRHARMADALALTYSALVDPVKQQHERIGQFLDVELEKKIGDDDPGAGIDRQRRLLLAAWLASRINDHALAQRAISAIEHKYIGRDYPELAQRHVLATAERLRSDGDSAAAIEQLTPLAAGNGFYSVRVALMDARTAAGELDEARGLAQWLAANRGVAYGEMHGDHMMQLFNVGQSNLALLSLAEQALALDRMEEAQYDLDAFLQVWHEDRLPPTLAARVGQAKSKLSEARESLAPAATPEIKS